MKRVMMGGALKRPVLLVAAALVFGSMALSAVPARAVPFDNKPKILLHVKGMTTKNICTTNGDLADCTTAITSGQVGTGAGPFYFMYLLVANGPLRGQALGGNDQGVAGMQCGIEYNPADTGFRVFTWTLCASLEFATTSTPTVWPQSGGGNLITWDSTFKCQKGEVSIAGYFYCGAYSPDEVKVIPRPVDGLAKVADCASFEYNLSPNDLGIVSFSADGSTSGCNPCSGLCGPTPVERTTWSSIKGLYEGGR